MHLNEFSLAMSSVYHMASLLSKIRILTFQFRQHPPRGDYYFLESIHSCCRVFAPFGVIKEFCCFYPRLHCNLDINTIDRVPRFSEGRAIFRNQWVSLSKWAISICFGLQ